MIKLVFMGTPDFAVNVLEGLYQADNIEVQAVVTQPDRPVGRKRELKATPVKTYALEQGLEILQPQNMQDEAVVDKIKEYAPDVIVTAAFGQFLTDEVLQIAPFGVVNVHASLLPKYRGGAPIHTAIINGDKQTGVTIMQTVKKMDAGDILSSQAIPITTQDNVGTMFTKLSEVGRDLLLTTLPKYLAGKITPMAQDETKVTYAPNITKEQEKIDFAKTATEIDCQVRGLNPWPVAYTMYNDKRLKIYEVTVTDITTEAKHGTIVERTKDTLKVACGQGTVLSLQTVQLAGKAKQTIKEFLNGSGQNIELGEKLG